MFRKVFLRRAQSLQIVDGKGQSWIRGQLGCPEPWVGEDLGRLAEAALRSSDRKRGLGSTATR